MNFHQFYEKLKTVSPERREKPVLIIKDTVIVNLDSINNSREGFLHSTDQLIYILHKVGKNKKFLFISEDGALVESTNGIFVIKNIVETFQLNEQSCGLVARENVKIENVTVINNEAVPYWCNVVNCFKKETPLCVGTLEKKFAAFYHRGVFTRLLLAQHLYNYYKDDSIISYQTNNLEHHPNLKEYFEEELEWTKRNTPIVFDKVFPNGRYVFEEVISPDRKPYSSYFVEIVCETEFTTTNWITEKTVKNFYFGKPFIVLSGPGVCEKLQSFGFKTFEPYINESYSKIFNLYDRIEAIKKEIDRLSTFSLKDLEKMQNEMISIFEHNRQVFYSHVK